MNTGIPQNSKYKLSRRGRKLQISDDARTLVALPKEVPERTWAEILQKEENDLIVLDIREEIVEDALAIGYEHYMKKQNALFTAHCAAEAWLKLIDWNFYRHDPGEDPRAYPASFIPKRTESWVPDDMPSPSPKDTWCKQDLNVLVEDTTEEVLRKWPSNSSIDFPVVEEIPVEYWFPGKVNGFDEIFSELTNKSVTTDYESESVLDSELETQSEDLAAASELLQRVTDYVTTEEELAKKESKISARKTTTPADGSLQGAGDSTIGVARLKRKPEKSKTAFSKPSVTGRSRGALPPLDRDSRSRVSVISDCRLRNLRLETQYEISSEKVDTPPPGEIVKRK